MKKILLLLLLMGLTDNAFSRSFNILYANNSARPLGMGGAFAAVQDSMQTHLYNPAAFATVTNHRQWDFSYNIAYWYLYENIAHAYGGESKMNDLQSTAAVSGAMALAVDNATLTIGNWFFKLNFFTQLITQGTDFPMHSSSATLGYRFTGILTGLQAGITGHLYNPYYRSMPHGASISCGLFYRFRPASPFSLGLLFFHVSDNMPWVREPFERLMNNSLNLGAAFELPRRFTLSVDLRYLNNFDRHTWFQPHLGLEKTISLGRAKWTHWVLTCRTGIWNDPFANSIGFSGGLDFHFYSLSTLSQSYHIHLSPNPCFFITYTLSRQENAAAYGGSLTLNHVIAAGFQF